MPVSEIKKRSRKNFPDVEKYNRQWDHTQHEIMTNTVKYPNRTVVSEYIDEDGKKQKKKKLVELNRIGLPYQKMITKTAATFFCGIPVKYINQSDSEEAYREFQDLIDDAKIRFIDKDVYVATSRYTECAEMWYFRTEKEEDEEGNESVVDREIRVKVLTPDLYTFYPEFDSTGKMIRFSREWKIESQDKEIFESYTAKRVERYERSKGGEWEEVSNQVNAIGKIPFVFYQQENVEWHDVQDMIERLEEIYSNIGESNDRFAFPILKLKGTVVGSMAQDRAGRVLQLEGDNADAEFAEQPNATESLLMEINRLERDVYDLTSTPNLSPEALKGLGNLLSGVAMRYFFMAAHLKVMDKQSIYEPAFMRRISIVAEMMNKMSGTRGLDVKPVITPFEIDSREALAEYLMSVNGGQPLMSQRMSMEEFGITDADEVIKEIEDDTNRRADYGNAFEFMT